MPALSIARDSRRAIDAAIRRLEKRAAEGDGQDASFEQSMSDVVHLVLKDKVPELLDYELGFQLVDRDSDANKAVGVTIFKVGPHFLFQPSFFISGRLKGTELLFVKDLDLFIPLQDGWVQHLIDKHPQPVGRRVGQNLGQLGISVPDLRQITRPPMKWAAFEEEVLPAWAAAVTSDPLAGLHYGLEDFVKEAGRPAVDALVAWVDRCPRLAYDLARYHGDGLVGACKEAAAPRPNAGVGGSFADWIDGLVDRLGDGVDRVEPGAESVSIRMKRATAGELREVRLDKAEARPSLFGPAPDEPKVRADGFSVEDERPDARVATAYVPQVEQRLTNPVETGLYDVLVRPLAYEKCLVAIGPKTAHGNLHPCTVVRLSDKAFVTVDAGRVWVGKLYDRKDFYDWWSGLPEASALDEHRPSPTTPDFDSKSYRAHQMLIGRDGRATAPFRAEYALGGSDGGKTYQVCFRTGRDSCPGVGHGATMASSGAYDDSWRMSGGNIAVGTHRGGKMFAAGGTLYAPADTRALDLVAPGYGEREAVIALGDPIDVHVDLHGRTTPLDVQLRKESYWIDGVPHRGEDAALRHLVFGRNLRLGNARAVLAKAAALELDPRDPVLHARVKEAGPLESSVTAPAIPDPATTTEETLTRSLPGQPAQFRLLPVMGMRPRHDVDQVYNLRNLPPPPWMQETIQDAAGSGSREIFDTSMIGAMLSTTQGDLQVDRYFGPLMKGQDAIGRILMAFYWHGDDFAERYGKEDLVSLEDSLRNTFINLGKLILNLKQNSVEDPLDADREMDLDNTADQ